MAKWGEGDPRWIVEERADTKNVNNWHWTEKNANNWSKDKLKSLLTGLKIDGAAGLVELKDFVSINGEASASNRKGKLIFFYEWELKINWTGRVNTEDMEEVSGTIEIPNLSEEQDICDIEVMVTVKDKTSGADAIKEMIRVKGAEVIRERLANYIDTLKIVQTNQHQRQQQQQCPSIKTS
ncbi:AHSA1 [Bugula neritina]|uniref:AHSA1 n=1 Tax=Bugula neritina TaxID=10212 RepID=A0A7J7KRS1_BUGNE|nr:AHSA1 [Bugula neritina]